MVLHRPIHEPQSNACSMKGVLYMKCRLNIVMIILLLMLPLVWPFLEVPINVQGQPTIIQPVRIQRVETITQSTSLESTYSRIPPSIDGYLGLGEWASGATITFSNVKITVLNDDLRLYVLFNVVGDTNDDESTNDYFWLTFDLDNDGVIDPTDVNYVNPIGQPNNLRYQNYTGSGGWSSVSPTTWSSQGRGFGCFVADGSLRISLFPSLSLSCNPHRVWELAIDLKELGVNPGDTVGMGFRIASGTPLIVENVPDNFWNDFSSLLQLTLATSPSGVYPPVRDGTVSFFRPNSDMGIEITQAVQNRQNTIPLVAGKTTVARAFIDGDASSSFSSKVSSVVYLYGKRGTEDLPGSPLVMRHEAPTSVDRSRKSHSANFYLPRSWVSGSVTFSALVRNWNGDQLEEHEPFTLTFTEKEVPTYWVIPINDGTTSSPQLVSENLIIQQQNALKTIFPVKNVKFVRKNWQLVGPCSGCTLDQVVNRLNQLLGSTFLEIIFNGGSISDLPDQIYGFTVRGGGTSDPTWYENGVGFSAAGYIGSSRALTFAHEVNHNLDRSSSGTWGRHVGNPSNGRDASWGCGASGPDPSWPIPPNNDDISRTSSTALTVLGFDTLNDLVIPGTTPDLMSYCQSSGLAYPKWISGYRWNNLFNRFATITSQQSAKDTSSLENIGAATHYGGHVPNQYNNMYYLFGHVNKNGTGNIDDFMFAPGFKLQNSTQGTASVRFYDDKGTILGEFGFDLQFTDLEGNDRDVAPFSLIIPEVSGATNITLVYNDTVIDSIIKTDNPPTVTVTSPTSGEQWGASGNQLITWSASDPDGDDLTFSLFYSSDGGLTWTTIAQGLKNVFSYEIDSSLLSSSNESMIRVVATDGFNTVANESALFSVASRPPTVMILSPDATTNYSTSNLISFQATAFDSAGNPLADNQTYWKVDGELLGMGTEFWERLPEGSHVITFGAVDAKGRESTTSVTIVVKSVDVDDEIPSPEASSSITTTPSTSSEDQLSQLWSRFAAELSSNVMLQLLLAVMAIMLAVVIIRKIKR